MEPVIFRAGHDILHATQSCWEIISLDRSLQKDTIINYSEAN